MMDKGKLTAFSGLFLKLRTEEEVAAFLSDILTPKEIELIINRWEIAKLLLDHKGYMEISRLTGTSSSTIAKVQESLKYGEGGFELVSNRLR